MAITAHIGGDDAGGAANGGFSWTIEYDDTTRRVTAQADGVGRCRVDVQVSTAGARNVVSFIQPGGQADADADYIVTVGAGPTLIGPTINPNQVARLVGKIGTPVGGLPFNDSWSRF